MTDSSDIGEFTQLREVIRRRHSERLPFVPGHHLGESDVQAILEAARWAPTAHNMQNFEIIVVDDEATLAAIGRVSGGTSEGFIRENYAQLSFSEEELIRKGTGLIATMFPPLVAIPGWQGRAVTRRRARVSGRVHALVPTGDDRRLRHAQAGSGIGR